MLNHELNEIRQRLALAESVELPTATVAAMLDHIAEQGMTIGQLQTICLPPDSLGTPSTEKVIQYIQGLQEANARYKRDEQLRLAKVLRETGMG